MDSFFFLSLIISLTVLLFSAILHEIAHGFVADRLGDPTARLLGRLTLNPIPHIDPFMSILLPLFLFLTGSPVIFGGAKPVPVDEFNLRDGRRDMALVALSGPLTNAVIALVAAALFYVGMFLAIIYQIGVDPYTTIFLTILKTIVRTNVLLAIFNLLPIPPLDGSKVFSFILPPDMARTYEAIGRFGPIILFLLLMNSGTQMLLTQLYTYALSLLGF